MSEEAAAASARHVPGSKVRGCHDTVSYEPVMLCNPSSTRKPLEIHLYIYIYIYRQGDGEVSSSSTAKDEEKGSEE